MFNVVGTVRTALAATGRRKRFVIINFQNVIYAWDANKIAKIVLGNWSCCIGHAKKIVKIVLISFQ